MSGLSRVARLSAQLALTALLAALTYPCQAWAQTAGVATESAVKAAFLSKFAGFVEWPAGASGKAGQQLVIGVMGNDAVATDLEQIIHAQPTDGNTAVLRRLRDGDIPADVNVLFIGAGRVARVRDIADAVRGPVLIVTEQADGLRMGGVLNFVVEGGRVRFAASVPAADARGLRLNARLLAVATTVEGRAR